MYEERLGTDWEDLSEVEAIDRAFALGVASEFGYENQEEFDRLLAALDSSYDRSIIDLAYQEGRQKARVLRGDVPDRGDVWDRLVGDDGATRDGDVAGSPPGPGGERGPAGRLPESLDRVGLLDGGDDLGALQYPRFLRSRSDDGDANE
ncbi:hypothetical protein HUG10_13055 [Halorarum halophilum]|uniref:Uncharacterized protein n=1 Tax=Halorarum halophilum TaxID=2743090 RepID=A0A7D5KEP2_9EURY|nr:hypothetical protein [Halobaculum halophilum]QLG28417.1 hypothetical protein HUG10_13055 [Halobaculum halophilum]